MIDTSLELPKQIAAALRNASIAELHEAVQKQTPVVFELSQGKEWGSTTKFGKTTIAYADCEHPVEALAHELLHAELKLNGYRQYLICVAGPGSQYLKAIQILLGILDNELQHHRMVPRFAELGCNFKYFYNEGDVNAFKKVRRAVERMDSRNSMAEFFTQFVTVIAPGGAQDQIQRNQIRNYLIDHAGQKNARKLEDIEAQIAEWRNSSSLDAASTIQKVLQLIDVGGSYWVGASADFPNDGFFVGAQFSLE